MKTYELYDRIASHGFEVVEIHTRALKAAVFQTGYVFVDLDKFESDAELKCALAHELGHIETGSFYNVYSLYDNWEKCEYKANKRAVELLMPYHDVLRAIHLGYWSPWALADYFDVTQEFAQMAIDMYRDDLESLAQH